MATTEDAPSYLYPDQTLSLAVDHLTRIFLENLATESRQAVEDAEAEILDGDYDAALPEMPNLDDVKLRDYLADMLEIEDSELSLESEYKAGLVALKALSMQNTQALLDLTLTKAFGGSATVSQDMLYVNDPNVMEALEKRPLAPNEIMVAAFGDFYEEQQIPGDPRRDVLIGVIAWHGFYLCRPVLVSLPDVEDKLIAMDETLAMPKQPNVHYIPAFGRH